MLVLYRLLKGVDQGLAAVLMLILSLMITPIFFVNTAHDAAALLAIRGAKPSAVVGGTLAST